MKTLKPILLSSFFFFLFSAQCFAQVEVASDCTEIDMAPKFGDIRDQGESDWCTSNVAADLIGYRMGLEPPAQVSVVDVALRSRVLLVNSALQDPEGQEMQMALERQPFFNILNVEEDPLWPLYGFIPSYEEDYKVPRGVCLESQLPARELKAGKNELTTLLRQLDVRGSPYDPNIFTDSSKNYQLTPELKMERLELENSYRKYLTAVTIEAGRRCTQRIEAPEYSVGVIIMSDASALSKVNQLLSQRVPVAMGFNAGPLVSKLISFGNASLNINNSYQPKVSNNPHTAILVGRRINSATKKCEYKIRNSWGRQTCHFFQDRFAKTCDPEGYFWMSSDDIALLADSFYWVK